MTTIDITALVLAARLALEALSLTLRRGTDATLETADACAALRALADAWARVLRRLPADVTPPEWGMFCGMGPADFATWLERDDTNHYFGAMDVYADGLRAWGREAQACVDEIDGDDGPEQGSAGGADTEPAPPNDAPSLAHAHASLVAAEYDPDAPVRCALTPLGHFAYAEPLPRGPEPVALAYREPETL
jgi:hypothetical protein